MSEALIVPIPRQEPAGVAEWEGAAQRGLTARRERESIIAQVLVSGVDYGVIPGTEKPTLLKPGAEKIADSLNLCPDYEPVDRAEDWDRGRFFYRYRCSLRVRGSQAVVATGLGSCNSMEARYRWRNAERACPECKKPAIIKGSKEYGGGWLCWKKKGGCGAKFPDADARIVEQVAGKVENDDPYSLVNTIDKMAQKRALVAAALNLGFSHKFTQDLEDGAPPDEQVPAPPDEPGSSDGPPIPPTVKPTTAPSGDVDTHLAYGVVIAIKEKTGQGERGPWTLYRIKMKDGLEFSTFDKDMAGFAREAGTSPVRVVYKTTPKGMNLISIGPDDGKHEK